MSATLTATEIIMDTMEAFKQQLPMLDAFTTQYSCATKVKGQQVIAHIEKLGTASTYDGTTGYANGATDAKDLLEDVAITLNQHAHVPAKIAYLDAIATAVNKYQKAVSTLGYVLGKSVLDYALAKVTTGNFSTSVSEAVASTDRVTLAKITGKLNKNGAKPSGRFGIISTDVATQLQADVRLASKLFYGQEADDQAYTHYRNLAGFANIWEYPTMPVTAGIPGFFGDNRALVLATAPPDHSQDAAATLGIPQQGVFTYVTDPDSGLTLLGIGWQAPGTFINYLTMALLYDAVAGNQGGAAGAKTDYAGCLLVNP